MSEGKSERPVSGYLVEASLVLLHHYRRREVTIRKLVCKRGL